MEDLEVRFSLVRNHAIKVTLESLTDLTEGEIKSIIDNWFFLKKEEIKRFIELYDVNDTNFSIYVTCKGKKGFNGYSMCFQLDTYGNRTTMYESREVKLEKPFENFEI